MSVQVSYKKQFVFGIMLLVILLVVVEGIVNVWWYQVNVCAFEKNVLFENLDDEAKRQLCLENFELRYTLGRIAPNQHGESININNEGFRGPDITKEKPENTYRIFVLGGSTTFGVGVKDDQTAPAHLQKIFDYAELDFKVQVINAGIPGAKSIGEVKFVKESLIEYDPDLFIIYDGYNDRIEVKTEGAILWKDRWLEICNIGKDLGFDTIITIQPLLGTGLRIPTDKETPFLRETGDIGFLKQYSLFMEQFEELNTSCTLTADLTGIFDKVEETIFFDLVHVNSRGNEVVAESWYNISLPVILDKASEINYESDNSSINNVGTEIESSSINFNSVLDESYNNLRNLFLSYKTPRVLLHLSTFFENIFSQQNIGFDQTKGGIVYDLDNGVSCKSLGGDWNGVSYCSVSKLTIKPGDTLTIKKRIALKILDKLVNYGTITIQTGGVSYVDSELINRGGTIIINKEGTLRGLESILSNDGGNITVNGGTLVNERGIVNNNLGGSIINSFAGNIYNIKGSTINNNNGTIINNAKSNFFNDNDSKFTNYKGSIVINNMGTFVNYGEFLNECGGIVIINGTFGPNQLVKIQCP